LNVTKHRSLIESKTAKENHSMRIHDPLWRFLGQWAPLASNGREAVAKFGYVQGCTVRTAALRRC